MQTATFGCMMMPLSLLAGDTLEKSWLHVSSSINCGKMRALEQLLHLWHSEGDNKVRS